MHEGEDVISKFSTVVLTDKSLGSLGGGGQGYSPNSGMLLIILKQREPPSLGSFNACHASLSC